jgi:glycosyltransferase family protein
VLNILKKKKYYSSAISRFYSHIKDRSKIYKYIPKLKKIWEGRDVLMIEGEKTRFGIGNDLLNNAKSVKRILCPTKNSYSLYDKILNAIFKFDKNYLILISLGPTATILAHDLNKYGYQAIDIGHADIQYELYLRNASTHIIIPYKLVNEYNGGRNEAFLKEAPDKKYYTQIVEKILN